MEFSLEQLALHGGANGPHRDGWGVAFYDDHDLSLLREPKAASESALVHFIEQHAPPSTLVISHIRKATHGARALRNTQPFTRELAGRMHLFAHNGELKGIEHTRNYQPGRFQPVGESDSERVFCNLLERLAPLWEAEVGTPPPLEARLEVITEFAAGLRPFGPANFLYADADLLFVHAHRRQQPDGSNVPPGLHLLHRSCKRSNAVLTGTGIKVSHLQQEVILVASVPLTDEPWQPLAEGEIIVLARGEILVHPLKTCAEESKA